MGHALCWELLLWWPASQMVPSDPASWYPHLACHCVLVYVIRDTWWEWWEVTSEIWFKKTDFCHRYSGSLSLSLITNSERSRLPCCGQFYEETQVTRKWSLQEELRPAQSHGKAQEAGMTAVPANSSTATWWILSQRHPAKPHPDSWPSETDRISACCLGWFVT